MVMYGRAGQAANGTGSAYRAPAMTYAPQVQRQPTPAVQQRANRLTLGSQSISSPNSSPTMNGIGKSVSSVSGEKQQQSDGAIAKIGSGGVARVPASVASGQQVQSVSNGVVTLSENGKLNGNGNGRTSEVIQSFDHASSLQATTVGDSSAASHRQSNVQTQTGQSQVSSIEIGNSHTAQIPNIVTFDGHLPHLLASGILGNADQNGARPTVNTPATSKLNLMASAPAQDPHPVLTTTIHISSVDGNAHIIKEQNLHPARPIFMNDLSSMNHGTTPTTTFSTTSTSTNVHAPLPQQGMYKTTTTTTQTIPMHPITAFNIINAAIRNGNPSGTYSLNNRGGNLFQSGSTSYLANGQMMGQQGAHPMGGYPSSPIIGGINGNPSYPAQHQK